MTSINKLIILTIGFLLLGVAAISAQDVVSDKEARKAERKAQVEQYRADIEAIKNDTSLTEEERKTKLKEVREAATQKQRRKKNKYRPGQGEKGKELNEERKAAREAYQAKIEVIENDNTLTAEQKEEAKKALRQEQRAKRQEALEAVGGKKAVRKAAKRKKNKLEKKIDSGLSEEEKTKVIGRLDKLEKKLDKQYSKGKIKEDNYTKRKAEITDLRSRL